MYDINIWAVPYYGESEQKDVGKVYGYDSKSYGIIAGIDKQITQHVKLGIGGRYEETDISSKNEKSSGEHSLRRISLCVIRATRLS